MPTRPVVGWAALLAAAALAGCQNSRNSQADTWPPVAQQTQGQGWNSRPNAVPDQRMPASGMADGRTGGFASGSMTAQNTTGNPSSNWPNLNGSSTPTSGSPAFPSSATAGGMGSSASPSLAGNAGASTTGGGLPAAGGMGNMGNPAVAASTLPASTSLPASAAMPTAAAPGSAVTPASFATGGSSHVDPPPEPAVRAVSDISFPGDHGRSPAPTTTGGPAPAAATLTSNAPPGPSPVGNDLPPTDPRTVPVNPPATDVASAPPTATGPQTFNIDSAPKPTAETVNLTSAPASPARTEVPLTEARPTAGSSSGSTWPLGNAGESGTPSRSNLGPATVPVLNPTEASPREGVTQHVTTYPEVGSATPSQGPAVVPVTP